MSKQQIPVVDDERAIREVLRRYLELDGKDYPPFSLTDAKSQSQRRVF